MVATLRSRQLHTFPAKGELSRSKLSPLLQGTERQGLGLRGAVWRRDPFVFRPQAAAKSPKGKRKGAGGAPFSLRDSETRGNIGLIGVLGTAVVVGGALVVFNPYAGQVINQTTIENVEVPTPLPATKSKSPPAVVAKAPPVATKPVAPPAPPKPKPSKPAVAVKPSVEPSKTTSLKLPSTPVARAKPAKASEKGGGSSTSLVGGLLLFTAVGAGVLAFSNNNPMESSVETSPAEPEVPPAAEPTPAAETPPPPVDSSETNVKEAKEWIAEWRESQE